MDAIRAAARGLYWPGLALFALAAGLAVVVCVDPGGDYPHWPQGPGLTLDESFNVQQGVGLAEAVWGFGLGILHPDTVREVFDNDFYLPDHPPLGRVWIGFGHKLAKWAFPTSLNETPYVVACARSAPAMAFAITVFLAGCAAARWYGRSGGLAAAAAVVLMPRVFGHAHLASLETFIGLAYTAAVLSVAATWRGASPPRARTAMACGAVFGMALATKIQAVLLPVPIGFWALLMWRRKGVLPLLIWGTVGVVVFFVLWPWLWLDPWGHVIEYLRRATERQSIKVWYFGHEYADVDVPWHYPFVMFLVTIPVGLLVLGFVGLFARREWGRRPAGAGVASAQVGGAGVSAAGIGAGQLGATTSGEGAAAGSGGVRAESGGGERVAGEGPAAAGNSRESNRRDLLVALCMLFPLLVFARPGGAVYDGTRLFLVSFPLWAVFVGRGTVVCLDWLAARISRRLAVPAIVLLFVGQAWGHVAVHPCYLSYYNLLVGGLPGANAMGLEVNYWGDSLTRDLLERCAVAVPEGSRVEAFPILYSFQWAVVREQCPALRRRAIQLVPYQGLERMQSRYLLVFRRRADLPEPIRDTPANSRVLAEVRRCGVQLAALYEVGGGGGDSGGDAGSAAGR